MKLFLISDIHGSEYYTGLAIDRFIQEEADLIIILGDILYHGARNDLPKGHNPKGVIRILNELGDKIIAVRGNCDSEVDQMVLDFPLMASYNSLFLGKRRVFLTHGHIYNEENMVKLPKESLFIYGHSHILRAEKSQGIYFLNPGSISLPKENKPHTYGIIENDLFQIKDLDGNLIEEISFK